MAQGLVEAVQVWALGKGSREEQAGGWRKRVSVERMLIERRELMRCPLEQWPNRVELLKKT